MYRNFSSGCFLLLFHTSTQNTAKDTVVLPLSCFALYLLDSGVTATVYSSDQRVIDVSSQRRRKQTSVFM